MRTIRTSKYSTILLTLFVVALFFALPSIILYSYSRSLIISQLGTSAMESAKLIARNIEEDVEPYEAMYQLEDYSTNLYDLDYYTKMIQRFATYKSDLKAAFVYTIKITSNTEYVYLLDGEDPNSDDFSPIGSIDELSEIELQVFQTKTATFTGLIYSERWGTYVTGFAPIIHPDSQQVLGLVGVDYRDTHVQTILQTMSQAIIWGSILLSTFAGFFIYKILDQRFIALETDYLTGVSSKRSHERFLEQAMKSAMKNNKPLTLIMLDIDNFKQINDIYGHDFGDEVLRLVGVQLIQLKRSHDSIARYGGDEFIFVLPNTTTEDAKAFANLIQERINQISLNPDDKALQITVSMGIASIFDIDDPSKILIAADRAMYLSKNTGKKKFTIYVE
ncbi:MAG: diguanylate cyclase [Candidatus Izemoplasmatales bacterium]|nr:diguanylate cyclase [bacterium]MDZ4195986.1 diguanylate cyclase [Candidatus Izemoplasmatales bacterium]